MEPNQLQAEYSDITKQTCKWEQNADGVWETECDEMFIFNDGNPEENGFKYCPYCGIPISQIESDCQ